MRKSIVFAVAVGSASLFVSTSAQATTGDWVGPSGATWSDPSHWFNNIVPNGQGDVAQYLTTQSGAGISSIAANDIAGVTVGTLRISGDTNHSMQFTPTQVINLNQDGAGAGHASVINDVVGTVASGTPPSATSNVSIFLNNATGGFMLQDDLWLINNSNSTRTTGSIQIRGSLRGAGNIYVENNTNDILAGAVSFQQSESGAGNGFIGNTTLAKGATTISRGDIFTPSPGNFVTIGAPGKGDVTLGVVTAVGGMENNFIVAAGTGGTSIFAARPMTTFGGNIESSTPVTIKSTNSYAAAIRLDGDLSFDNRNTIGTSFIIGDPITGVGKVTKIGVGTLELINTNSYSGGTVVNSGILKVRHADAFNNGFGFYVATDGTLGTSTVTINSGVANSLAATRLQIDTSVASINVIANTATLSLAGGGSDAFADLGANVNEVVGGLILGGVAQTVIGTYGSSTSGATFQNDQYFSGTGMITLTPDFNVDGVIDAQDYVVWRKAGGDIGAYNNWRANFGYPPAAGSGLSSQAVPEPGSLLLAMAGVLLAWTGRRHR